MPALRTIFECLYSDFQQKIVISKHTHCAMKIKVKTPNMFRNLAIFLYCVQAFLIISPYYSVTNEGAFSLQAVSNFLILYCGDRYISRCDLREEQHKELLLVCCKTLKLPGIKSPDPREVRSFGDSYFPKVPFFLLS